MGVGMAGSGWSRDSVISAALRDMALTSKMNGLALCTHDVPHCALMAECSVNGVLDAAAGSIRELQQQAALAPVAAEFTVEKRPQKVDAEVARTAMCRGCRVCHNSFGTFVLQVCADYYFVVDAMFLAGGIDARSHHGSASRPCCERSSAAAQAQVWTLYLQND